MENWNHRACNQIVTWHDWLSSPNCHNRCHHSYIVFNSTLCLFLLVVLTASAGDGVRLCVSNGYNLLRHIIRLMYTYMYVRPSANRVYQLTDEPVSIGTWPSIQAPSYVQTDSAKVIRSVRACARARVCVCVWGGVCTDKKLDMVTERELSKPHTNPTK